MDKDVVYVHNEYYSAIKKNEIMAFAATQMDVEIIMLSEIRQRQIQYISYMCILKKIIQMKLFTKQNHRQRKLIYSYQRGKGRGDKLGVWD